MSTALANFLFEVANFLLLAAALGWVLFKPVRAALDAERGEHEKTQERVAALRDEAETLARAAREAHAHLDSDLQQRRAEILAAAQKDAERIREEGRQAQADRLRTLAQESEAVRREQAGLLAEVLGRIAAASVRRLLDAFDGPPLDLALIRGASKELEAFPQEARRAAVVESARPLDATCRELLRGVLGDAFEERTVSELGAGVRVTTPMGQVDASALALARQAERDITSVASLTPQSGAGHG